MFRATILTVVLLFAAGPGPSLFCKAWCDPQAAAENGCHREDDGGGASVGGDQSCDDSVQGTDGVLKEHLRRAPASHGGAVCSSSAFPIIPAATHVLATRYRARPPSALNQPQTTPLRI